MISEELTEEENKAELQKLKDTKIEFYDGFETHNKLLTLLVGLCDLHKTETTRSKQFLRFQFAFFTCNLMLTIYFLMVEAMYYYILFSNFNKETILRVAEMMPCTLLTVMGGYKGVLMVINREKFVGVVETARGMWPNADNLHIKKLMIYYVGKGKKFCDFYVVQMLCLVTLWTGIPIGILTYNLVMQYFLHADRRWNDGLLLIYEMWLPYDVLGSWYAYFLTYTGQFFAGYFVTTLHATGDAFICILVCHFCLQLNLLQREIRMLNNKEEEAEEYERITDLEATLKKVVEKHNQIFIAVKSLEEIFTTVLFINLATSSFMICFQLISMIIAPPAKVPKHVFFIVVAVVEIGLMCYYGDKLKDENEGIKLAAYSSGWESSTRSHKNAVMRFQTRASQELYISALNFTTVSMETFSGILSASWSYFTLLHKMYGDE